MFEWLLDLLKQEVMYPIVIPALITVIVIIIGAVKESKKLLGGIVSGGLLATLYFELKSINVVMGSPVIYPAKVLGYGTEFVIDGLSLIMATIFTFVSFTVAIYSIGYMGDDRIYEYYTLLLLMIFSLNGVALAGDLLTLFIFYELLGIASYLLVAFNRSEEAIEAAIKYLIMGGLGAALILLGMAILYGEFGTLNIRLISAAVREKGISTELYLPLSLFIFGFGVEAAIFPMHFWVPDAYSAAPSGISAILSGVVKKAGMFALIKVLIMLAYINALGMIWNKMVVTLLLAISAATVTIPNLCALVQRDINRMLAYSSVYNMGIILAGITVGTKFAIAAAIFHVLNHALAKALLFMGSGAYMMQLEHSRSLDDYRGVGYTMPVTSTLFSTGTMSLAAFPPLAGFWSKFLLIWAATVAGFEGNVAGYIVATIIAVNAVIAVGYYFAVLIRTIWMSSKEQMAEKAKKAKEAPLTVFLAMNLLFALIIAISVVPLVFFDYISKGVESFFSAYA